MLVHGTDLAAADGAVSAAGLARKMSFDKIGVVVARGTKAQIAQVRTQPGVTYVEGNAPIELSQETSNTATRGDEAFRTLQGAEGTPLSGAGTSVGIIDSGVDPTHPYLTEADGTSAVVSNQKVLCDPTESACQVLDLPTSVDTDTLAVGGHGTHVAGIAAGRPTTLSTGGELHGAAPGAKIVSLSTGAALVILGADTALNWVLREPRRSLRHRCPGRGVPADQGHQQLPWPVRWWRVRPRVGDREAPACAGSRGCADRLGQRQRRRGRLREHVEPTGHGPDRWRHLGGVLQRPGDGYP